MNQISDGITSDASPFNGFGSRVNSGTIEFDLQNGPYNISAFRLWNDINVQNEGIQDFTLNFYSSGNLVGSYSDTAAINTIPVQLFTFPTKVGVDHIELVVNNVYSTRFGIEIREVQFDGIISEDIELEAAGRSGRDIHVKSKYGPLPIKLYCEGDPVLVSINSPSNASGYFVGLSTFNPITWQDTSTIKNGYWKCSNCTPPPFALPADEAPAGILPPNDPGEIYLYTVATGPVWKADHFFFRVVKCGNIWGDDAVDIGGMKPDEIEFSGKFPELIEPVPLEKGNSESEDNPK